MVNSNDSLTTNISADSAQESVETLRRERQRDNDRLLRDTSNEAANLNLLSFLALLFDLKDEDSPKTILDTLSDALNIDDSTRNQIFSSLNGSSSSIKDIISNPSVSDAIRNQYNIDNPGLIASKANDVFTQHSGDAWDGFLEHLMVREGSRNDAYKDSLGKLTIGVGHLVTPEDIQRYGWREGSTISDEMVMDLLKEDASKAYEAAISQAEELNMVDKETVMALASVNYQLGTAWNKEFSQTWAKMERGDFEGAIRNVEASLWNDQTPVRVDDFQSGLARMAQIRDNTVEIASLSGERTQLASSFDSATTTETPLDTDTSQPDPLVASFDGHGVDEVAKAAEIDASASLIAMNNDNTATLATAPGA